jgi:pimeloyl-ACP methyl ester carboxylesterase
VLIHGLMGTLQHSEILDALRPALTIAPDLMGYGSLRDAPLEAINVSAQIGWLNQSITQQFGEQPVHLVGHSIGGAIAYLFAHRCPERVREIVSVEGNFTLKDAFWSASVAKLSQQEAEHMLDGFLSEPTAWLARSGIPPEPQFVAMADKWLSQQPASTIQAMAQSIVETTGAPDYPLAVRAVFARHPVHLLAGERSRAGWDVPDWANKSAASFTVLPSTGHMMMLEEPRAFAKVVSELLRHQ